MKLFLEFSLIVFSLSVARLCLPCVALVHVMVSLHVNIRNTTGVIVLHDSLLIRVTDSYFLIKEVPMMTIRKTIILDCQLNWLLTAIDPFVCFNYSTCYSLNKEINVDVDSQRWWLRDHLPFQGLSGNWKWVYFLFSMWATETIKINIEHMSLLIVEGRVTKQGYHLHDSYWAFHQLPIPK